MLEQLVRLTQEGDPNSGCFNGNFSDNINSYWGDTSITITFTFSDLPFKKLRFYAVGQNISNSYVKFNGVTQTQAKIGLTNLKFGWFDAVDVPSPLNKIEVYTAGSSDFLSLYAVEVDGKILVNNNITPPQLPSIPATGSSVGTEQGFSIVTYTASEVLERFLMGSHKILNLLSSSKETMKMTGVFGTSL